MDSVKAGESLFGPGGSLSSSSDGGYQSNFGKWAEALNKSNKIPLKLLNELLITMKKGSLCALCGAIPVPIMNILKYFSDEMKSDIIQEN